MPATEKITADSRLKILIDSRVKLRHRVLLAILNDNAKEQVMIVHHMISKSLGKRPSVLWCHKKDSEVPKQSRKQLKKLEKNLKSGKCDISQENAFDVFLLSTAVKYCSFGDSQTILGSTYGMCVIQDFEGISPNSLCRVVETVSGGGAVVFLLSGINSLRSLFSLTMDVHHRLKTFAYPKVTPLFNERFVVSLGWCESCLILDSKLQVMTELPSLSGQVKQVGSGRVEEMARLETQLTELRDSLQDADKPLPQLVQCCRTFDQTKAVLKMIDVLTEKGGRGTVSLTAGRGRGKSAALGLAVSAAIHFSLSNIFVTSPAPNTLATFFEFVFKGFDALGYEEQKDYEIIQSTNAEFSGAIVRVNVFREHRQIIQYVEPTDHEKLSQAELLVIDEAAAIPLPHVKALLGPYNVIMASTITGYEGTGRSLSLKLLQQLREQSGTLGATAIASSATPTALSNRTLHEVTLEESVRYGGDDPVEAWLHRLLCLAPPSALSHPPACPPPQHCSLYAVNRSVLLSGHSESERLLSEMMWLLAASHYRNSPDDLQMLSDAPAHRLYILLPPIVSGMATLPQVLAVVQVCVEGGIPVKASEAAIRRGDRPSGDLVPWTLASQFLDPALTQRTGLRVIRVAVHPDYQSMGYGSRAINLLREFCSGQHLSLETNQTTTKGDTKEDEETSAESNVIVPRQTSEPLLLKLDESVPDKVDYLSVSYGLTLPLLKFWSRAGYLPLYISQVVNKVTGEHSCVMVRPLENSEGTDKNSWVEEPSREFIRRFMALLGGPLADLHPTLALKVMQAHDNSLPHKEVTWSEIVGVVSGHDLQRLERYSKNLADRHLITDLLPSLASLFFTHRLPSVHLSALQAGLLLGMGLQMKSLDIVINSLDLPVESALGQFNRAIRRLLKALSGVQEAALAQHLPKTTAALQDFVPVSISLDQDLQDAAEDYEYKMRAKEDHVGSGLLGDISKFAIRGDEASWQSALETGAQRTSVSIKSMKRPAMMTEEELERELQAPPTKQHKTKKDKKKKF